MGGVEQVKQGVTLLAQHQEGIVPKIVATLKTQAKTITQVQNIPRPTAAEFAAMQACFAKLGGSTNRSSGNSGGLGGGGGGGGLGGGGGGPGRRALPQSPPPRLQKLRASFPPSPPPPRPVLP